MANENDLMTEFEAAKKTYDDLVASKGKALIGAIFGTAFAACPEIKKIQWTQYTPHFNDGDACEFGVHEPSFLLEGSEGFQDTWELRSHPSRDAFDALTKRLQAPAMEDVFESTFGDHVEVTASRDAAGVVSFESEEYEHD